MRKPSHDLNRDLQAGELAHLSLRVAADALKAATSRLLFDVRGLALDAPLKTFQARVESWCMTGGMLAAVTQRLEDEGLSDPTEWLDS